MYLVFRNEIYEYLKFGKKFDFIIFDKLKDMFIFVIIFIRMNLL